MTVRDPLPAFLYGRHVADLLDAGPGDPPAIRYTEEALGDPPRSRVSLSLPVQEDLYPGGGLGGRWVRSLLPEGRALAWAVSHFNIPENDRYSLIASLGRDVAGAVEIRSEYGMFGGEPHYEALSEEELASLVSRAHKMGLGLDRERGVRLSLAGVQDKVLLHHDGSGYLLPVHGAPSTLILKPEPPKPDDDDEIDLTGLASNELFCLQLATLCGIDTPVASVIRPGGRETLAIERYDRVVAPDGVVSRIHQEDVLSALGLDPQIKYERSEAERATPGGWHAQGGVVSLPGPSLRIMADLLATQIGVARLEPFLERVAFNLAIGNADAHARNYSVLLPDTGVVQLSPIYDVVCTRAFSRLDREAAQRLAGETFEVDEVPTTNIVKEGCSWGIPEKRAEAIVRGVLEKIRTSTQTAGDACVARGGDEHVADDLATWIERHAVTMLNAS